jgi:hypothetical protein
MRRGSRGVFVVAVIAAATGCTPPKVTPKPEASGQQARQIYEQYRHPTGAGLRQGVQVDVCLDGTGSYRASFTAARNALATQLEHLVQPGVTGSTIRIHIIGTNSYDRRWPDIGVPPLGVEPQPLTNAPDFQPGLKKQAAERVAQFQKARTDAVHDLHAALAKLRAFSFPDDGSTDIDGCFQSAAEAHVPGAPWRVVIASDMRPDGVQQNAGYRLTGAAVDVVYFACSEAVECGKRRATWSDRLTRAGAAAPVRFHTPSDTLNLFPEGHAR